MDCFKCCVCLMKLEPGDYYTTYNDRLYCKDDIEFLLGDNDTSSSANGMCVQVLEQFVATITIVWWSSTKK